MKSSTQTTQCPTCSRFLSPFLGSDKFLHKFWAFRKSFHFKYKFRSTLFYFSYISSYKGPILV